MLVDAVGGEGDLDEFLDGGDDVVVFSVFSCCCFGFDFDFDDFFFVVFGLVLGNFFNSISSSSSESVKPKALPIKNLIS